jgi:3-oxoadipate enol-lactonase
VDNRRIEIAGGLGVAILEAGPAVADGGRPLLLQHGFVAAKEDFADHLDALGAVGWHAVAPDLRGHGGSDHPPGRSAYGLRIFASDLLGVADALGWHDRFTLLGHSAGGMVAQHVALAAPHRLDGLVLMDTAHGPLGGVEPEMIELGRSVVAEGGMPLFLEVSKTVPDVLGTPAHERLLATRPGYAEYGDRKTLSVSPDMWLELIGEILETQADRLDALAALGPDLPVLVMVGEQDEPFIPHSQRMAGAIPDAHLVVIPDAGHSPQFENGPAWFGALTAFLDRVAEGQRLAG